MLEGQLLPDPHKLTSSLHITLGCAHPHKLQRQLGAFRYTPHSELILSPASTGPSPPAVRLPSPSPLPSPKLQVPLQDSHS